MLTHKYLTNRVVLFATLIVAIYATDVEAQSISNDNKLFFNMAGHYSNQSHDYHNIGLGDKSYSSAEEWSAVLSIISIWWIGKSTAVEIEGGYWTSSVSSEKSGDEQSLSSDAWFVMPHFLLAFGAGDSVFIPYAKVGVGIFTGDQDGIPIGWSAGLGVILPLNHSLSVNAEASYKLKTSSSGRHVTVEDEWQGAYLSVGIGVSI